LSDLAWAKVPLGARVRRGNEVVMDGLTTAGPNSSRTTGMRSASIVRVVCDPLPETVMAQAVGRPLADLVSHPLLEDATIVGSLPHDGRAMSIEVERSGATLRHMYGPCTTARLMGPMRRRRRLLEVARACDEGPTGYDRMTGVVAAAFSAVVLIMAAVPGMTGTAFDGMDPLRKLAWGAFAGLAAVLIGMEVTNMQWMDGLRGRPEHRWFLDERRTRMIERMENR
jgi:hypothetical protein